MRHPPVSCQVGDPHVRLVSSVWRPDGCIPAVSEARSAGMMEQGLRGRAGKRDGTVHGTSEALSRFEMAENDTAT